MGEKTYTGAALEQALKDNALTKSGIVLVGMVKPAEKAGHINFTRTGCENWVDLPVDLIECAEHVGQGPCKDHSHPVMKITLKEPKDPAAQIYAALLAQSGSPHAGGPMPGGGHHHHHHHGHFASHGQGVRADGGGAPGPGYSMPRSSARIGLGGTGHFPGGGGLNAWGCWDSCCGSYCAAGHYEAGPVGWVWVCDWWVCSDPCEKCIWPW